MLPREIVRPGAAWLLSLATLTYAADQWASFALPAAYLALLGAAVVTLAWGTFVTAKGHVWWLLWSVVPGAIVYALTIGFDKNSESDWLVLANSCLLVGVALGLGGVVGALLRLRRKA